MQNIIIQNPGSCAVEFDVRLNAMKDVQAENFNFPIFRQHDVESGNENVMIDEVNGNLSLRGFIEAGGKAMVPFIFQPLEEKEYKLSLPITYRGANGEPCAIGVAVGTGVSEPATSNEAVLDVTLGQRYHPDPIENVVTKMKPGACNVDKNTPLGLESSEHLERIKVAASRAHDRLEQLEAGKIADAKRVLMI